MNDPVSSLGPMLAQLGADSAEKPQTGKAGKNRAEIEAASQKFEAMMVQMLLKQMQQSMGSTMFADGHLAMFQDFFNQEMAEKIQQGGGLGLADQMMRSMDAVPGSLKPGGSSHVFLNIAPMDAKNRQTHSLRELGPSLGAASSDDAELGLPPVEGLVTSRFGLRKDPFNGSVRQHAGLDIAAPEGTPIRAVAPGKVVFAGPSSGYGNLVVVRHEDGTETRYGHCSQIDVSYGDAVTTTSQLGTVGSTGRATGPHVHFEVRKDGRSIDPESWLANSASKFPQPSRK